ncbi:hypothetical protein J6590_082465 [Homalodisca vitripennis]|nr:hypothetical protein J6590_082465 [Homalodisca vitripennis]
MVHETSADEVRLDRVRHRVSGYIRRSSLQGLKRLTADDSSTTVRKYAVPGFLALSVAVFRSVFAVEVVESESPPPHTPR